MHERSPHVEQGCYGLQLAYETAENFKAYDVAGINLVQKQLYFGDAGLEDCHSHAGRANGVGEPYPVDFGVQLPLFDGK